MSSVVIAGNTSGSVTLDAPAIAGTTVLTLPAVSGTVLTTASTTGISGSAITTGTVGVSVGGTGANTLTANNVILGNGTSAVQFVAPGANGNLLTSNGTTWTSAAAPAGGVTSLNGQTGAITDTNYGAIGSYVIAAENDFTSLQERLPDVTVAGSTLIRTNLNSSTQPYGINGFQTTGINNVSNTNLGFSGTWRRLTRSNNASGGTSSAFNLYVRVS